MAIRTDIDVKGLRERLGWSQARLAEELGIDRSTVSRLERGETRRLPGPVRKLLDPILAQAAAATTTEST